MEFLVTRTSSWGSIKPCENAYEKEYDRIDKRSLKSFDEYDRRWAVRWQDEGFGHCINKDGNIERRFKERGWFIKISTLKALMEFREKYGELVLRNALFNEEIPAIEIYDDYRE